VGLGIDELSVHPPLVARIKAAIRRLDAASCARAARAALKLDSADGVRRLLVRRHLQPASLAHD
jgi:phosphoenolpyruvate-protein kinase (PTS system EI component)